MIILPSKNTYVKTLIDIVKTENMSKFKTTNQNSNYSYTQYIYFQIQYITCICNLNPYTFIINYDTDQTPTVGSLPTGGLWDPSRARGKNLESAVVQVLRWLGEMKIKHWVMVSNIFYFHPKPWGSDPIWLSYFSDGLVQPPTWSSWGIFWKSDEWPFFFSKLADDSVVLVGALELGVP